MSNRALAFLGLGKKTPEAAAEIDKVNRAASSGAAAGAAAASPSDDDDEDEDEEDEDDGYDEDEDGDDDNRKAARGRNRLRAAGRRRGAVLERERLAAVMNDLDPSKVEMALHLLISTDLAAAKIRGTLDKAPKGKATGGFTAVMDQISAETRTPSFGGGDRGARKPSLSDRMSADLKRRGWVQ